MRPRMLQENGKPIVCGVLLLVLAFNFGIAYTFLRSRGKLFKGTVRGFKFGWQKEDEALAELRDSVASLEHSTGRESEAHEED